MYIHLHINIPLNYPKKAPKVELKTYLAHPNVYSEWICLDMLEDSWIPHHRSESKADLYTGLFMHCVLCVTVAENAFAA